MMLVAGVDDRAFAEVHAETGTEQRLLDVVRRQGVAGEQFVDVSIANQLAHERPAAGVDDRGTADEQRLAGPPAISEELPCDFSDDDAFGLLSRYGAVHEGKGVA